MSIVLSAAMCVAINVYHEGRSTTEVEQQYIASTVYNRARNNETKPCDEVFKKGQYSWTSKYKKRLKFKDMNDVFAYYNIKESDAFYKASYISVITQSTRPDNQITFYHDKTVKNVYWSKGMKIAYNTKYFIFYKV